MVTNNRHVAASKDEYILGNAINIKCVFLMKSKVKMFYHNENMPFYDLTASNFKHLTVFCSSKSNQVTGQYVENLPSFLAGVSLQE